MLKDLLKEGGLYTLANFLTKGVSLLLIPFYTAYFSPSDYGIIDLITVFGFFITGVLTLQLSQGLARYVAEPTLKSKEKIIYASSAIWFSILFLFLSYLVIVYFSDRIIGVLFGESEIKFKLFFIAVTSIFLNAIFYFLGVYFRFTRKAKIFSLLSFLHALFSILLTSVLVIKFNMGIISIYISYLIVVPILIIVQFFLLRKEIILIISKIHLTKMLSYSVPLIPVGIAVILLSFTDRLFIKYYFSLSELGIYGIAAKFSTIIGVIISGFSMAIGPLILQNHNTKKTKNELSKIFNLYIGIGSVGVLSLSLFSYETVELLTSTDNFLPAHKIMPIMYFTSILLGLQMFSPGLMIRKKTGLMALITVISAAVNIVLNYIFIPSYGIVGAAYATFISTVLQQITFFTVSLSMYRYEIKIKENFFFGILMLIIILLPINELIENQLVLYIVKMIVIASFTYLLYIFQILNINKIKEIILNKVLKIKNK